MLEKLKDLLYETSDILLALVIIFVMSTVITWKVSDSLAFSKEADFNTVAIDLEQQKPMSNNTPATETPSEDTEQPETVDPTVPEQEPITESSEPPVQDSSQTVVTIAPPQPQSFKIVIPNGTHGAGIATILKQNGVIDNTGVFITRVQELKLESKLKSGTFTIPSGSSLDDAIYIITGTKK